MLKQKHDSITSIKTNVIYTMSLTALVFCSQTLLKSWISFLNLNFTYASMSITYSVIP